MKTAVQVETGSNGTVVLVEPALRKGLTRRVFRPLPHGHYDWCSYEDWRSNGERARFFGWSGKELPNSMTT